MFEARWDGPEETRGAASQNRVGDTETPCELRGGCDARGGGTLSSASSSRRLKSCPRPIPETPGIVDRTDEVKQRSTGGTWWVGRSDERGTGGREGGHEATTCVASDDLMASTAPSSSSLWVTYCDSVSFCDDAPPVRDVGPSK